MTPQDALTKAKQLLGGNVGTAARLKELSGGTVAISGQAVSQWKRCPHHHVLAVEAASGVSRHDLRPDLYPRDEAAA